ncbi:hypothetical protein O3G_MSEX002470 [Manduca sexta]|uniref:Uncharacterized protein n=1 Tax=Manduca sexta TaxID=7130 RepID=A0A921YP04_MANSE|nr:hypothetical protein O3G_MSEX002470 [Manduca sexta]
MSEFIKGVEQIANDPTTSILNAIQRYLFRKQADTQDVSNKSNVKIKSRNEMETTIQKTHASYNIGYVSMSRSDISVLPKSQSKGIQVGNGLGMYRQSSVQCSRSDKKILNKYTSVHRVQYSDREVGSLQIINKKDAETNTAECNLCEKHRQVFKLLKNFEHIKSLHRRNEIKFSNIKIIKYKLMSILKSLDVEKIQSIPEYRPPKIELLKLYRHWTI